MFDDFFFLRLLRVLLHSSVLQDRYDFREVFPRGDVEGRFLLFVPQRPIAPGLQEDAREFPSPHRGCDVKSRVAVLVLVRNSTLRTDQDPSDPCVAVPRRSMQGSISVLESVISINFFRKEEFGGRYVILQIRVASGEEEFPAALVVSVLAAKV